MNIIKFLLIFLLGGVVTTTGIYAYKNMNGQDLFKTQVNSVQLNSTQIKNLVTQEAKSDQKKPDKTAEESFNQAIASPMLDNDEQNTIDIYKQISPSVVNIATVTYEEDFMFEVVPRQGAGSGFIFDKSGLVLTNNHVVEGAKKLSVTFEDQNKSYPATLVGLDSKSDLAVIKVKAPAALLKPVILGDSSRLQVGQKAIAIGNPFGIGRTITTGVISALNRKVRKPNSSIAEMIQTDASINQGNSGGALINSRGEVIGINAMIYSPSGGSVGIGFAIPINAAKRFLPALINKGKVSYPWLGVRVLALEPDYKEYLELPVYEGLLVVQIVPKGPAAVSGIRGGNKRVIVGNVALALGGDIIVAIDGVKMYKETDLSNYIESQKNIGDTITVSVIRGNKLINIPVKLFEKPE